MTQGQFAMVGAMSNETTFIASTGKGGKPNKGIRAS